MGRMYLKLVCNESKVFEGRAALCIPLLLLSLGEVRQGQPGMGAHWELGFLLLKNLVAPDRSWSSQRQDPISKLQSCSFGAH